MTLGHPAFRPDVTRPLAAALLALGATTTMVLAQAGFEFMPDGGRNLLVQVVKAEPATLAGIAARKLDAGEWLALVQEHDAGLTEAEGLTLAGYLALNLPLAEPAALAGLPPEKLADALPRDGKDLAIRHCQGCHGFYTGYLGHHRDMTGWMVMFNSPFHTEIRMNPTERRTFAQYSAENLPMPIEDVPADLRH
ncbi:MAG: hypothetical protein CVT84_06315 [Alphaproteobacteria bacterium HGW-Alphaproteobacteria-6]|nr:MAG: hypothetical protein CVT84_06315 [Alphaproteobacteria bacterium HGW-Alphaproteobacteria-6]